MINKLLYNSILAIFLLLLSSSIIIPEIPVDVEEGKLEVSGRIKNEKNKDLDSALVIVTDSTGRKTLHKYYTDEKGKFKFTLDYNEKVRVYFEHPGYVTMFGSFDTKVPNSKIYKNLYYEASIALLDDSSNFNKQTAKVEPFLLVAYNSGFEIFIEDLDHTFNFIDQVTEPNVGKLTLSGMVQDSTADSLKVRIEAIDSLGRIIAETKTDFDGKYEIEVPLMSKTKLVFISDSHHPSNASIEGLVPNANKEEYYNLKHNFILIPEEERITENVKKLNEDKILFNPVTQNFAADKLVRKNYEYAVAVSKRRLLMKGTLIDKNGGVVIPMEIEVLDGDALYASYEVDSPKYNAELPYQSMVRVNFKAKGYHPMYVDINTKMGMNEMDSIKEFIVPIELISEDSAAINSDAFELPAKKFYYDPAAGLFILDTAASSEFAAKLIKLIEDGGKILDTAVATGFLMLSAQLINFATGDKIFEGRVKILNENKSEVSSILTDKKGKFSAQLGLNKLYYLEFEKEGYHATRIKIDTKVPKGMENTDINQGGLVALIVHKDDEINGKIVPAELMEDMDVTGYYFSEEQDAFVEDTKVYESFMDAVMAYKPPLAKLPKPPVDTVKEVILPTTIALKGKAVDKFNEPLAEIDIDFIKDGKKVTKATTDENGNFKIELPIDQSFVAELSKKGYHTATVSVDTKVEDKKAIIEKEIAIPNLKMYQEDDLDANPVAFKKDMTRISYNPSSMEMKSDPEVQREFTKTLVIIPDNQKLAVKGKTKDANGKTIGSTKIMVYEGAKLVDSVRSDEKGNYELLLAYQKDYRVVVEEDGYYRSYAAVSTKTAVANQRLVDKKVKDLDLVIVNRKEAKINAMAFLKPFSRVKFDADKNEFVEVGEVEEDFMANLFVKPKAAPKKEEKDEKGKGSVQLEVQSLAVKQIIAKPVSDEDYIPSTVTTAGAERQAQKNLNRSQAAANTQMNNFHRMMNGVRGQKAKSMRDMNLDMEQILSDGYSVTGPREEPLNDNMIKALETRQMLNQIVAEAVGFRNNKLPPISTDSIFDLNFRFRVEHSTSGRGVYQLEIDKILHKNKITEYVQEREWWFFYDYYKNGVLIDESEYEEELAVYKKNAGVVTMN